MKFLFSDKANEGGIYKIVNINNGRIYIGSTYRFKKRAYLHKNDLVKGRHKNTFLQNDFSKCGEDAFLFEVLEVVRGEENDRLIREQFFIDQHYDNQKNCYNLEKKAGLTRKNNKNKNTYDPTTDGRSKSKTEEWRKVTSEKNKEFWNQPEMRKFASERAKKKWANHSANIEVVHIETNEKILIEGSIRQFCLNRGISYKAFHLMVKGYTKSSAGWKLVV